MQAVRALLLTDVVDSTQLAQRLGDAAAAALWAAHDRVARDLLPAHRGREIDKTDGMLLLFDHPADAARYALAYHRAMAALQVPLSARAGLHVGPVLLRENPPEDVARGAKPLEVDGLAKPTTARVMALARGGQTLLSAEAHAALAADGLLDAGAGLAARSHGHWLLKGVAEPVELFELGEPGPGFQAPDDGDKAHRVVLHGGRWLPVRQIANNLPAQLTSFVGRERELAELKQLLGPHRLLTLLGMGGLGKTRLSLQLAAEVMADYPDGVWFLDLAPLRDGALVTSQAAQAIGVRDEPGRPLLQALCAQLRDQRVLLIFDNCEHLLAPVARLAHALLLAAPGLAIVASSREALRVPGERTCPVLPLPVPQATDSAEQLAASPAVQLFVQRAQQHRPDFRLGPAGVARDVAALVARLEGIPLALELAAARVRSMTVADINRRLARRYQVLTGGSRVLAERQQTLRALVDWSYDMLGPAEQRLFQRLAVFAGGFSLAAAEQVGADDDLVPDWEVPDLLASLVEKSLLALLHPGADAGEGRYQMLETLRDYAAEKLDASGDRSATAARHGAFFFTLAKQARDGLQGPEQGRWLARLDTEHDNLRVAMATAQAGGVAGADGAGDPFVAVKLAVALQNFWIMRGHVREGRDALAAIRALPAVGASDQALGHALYVAAALAWAEGEPAEAHRLLDEALARRRALGHAVDIAATLSTRSATRLSSGDAVGAQADAQEALAIFRGAAHPVGEAITLLQLGEAQAFAGEDAAALVHLQAALALARAIGHPETEGEVERALADLALAAGDLDTAAAGHARSLAVCAGAGDLRGEAQARAALARTDLARGDLDRAAERLRPALLDFERCAMRAPWLQALEDVAALLVQRADTEAAATAASLVAAVDALRSAAGLARTPRAEAAWQALQARLRTLLGPAALAVAAQQARRWDGAQAQARALAALAPPGEPGRAAAPASSAAA